MLRNLSSLLRARPSRIVVKFNVRSFSSAAKEETIFQHSSGFGPRGAPVGVAVVRVSGPGALQAFRRTTGLKKDPVPRMATISQLIHPVTQELLDPSALFLYFEGPKSFTGENVLEIHVHGNALVVEGTLAALKALDSPEGKFRLSEPGEFTKRAFMNRKMDLTQVEGLADLLNAETEQQRAIAVRQMAGELGRLYNQWRTTLLTCWAHCEAVIDFAEDEADVGEAEIMEHVIPQVKALYELVSVHMHDQRRGELIRKGLDVAIVGPPNVGKSSLLNKLAQRDVAIVSHIPGTTRDVVEVALNLGGFPVILADTAGIRETEDIVEQEGVRRSHQRLASADLKLVVFDASESSFDETAVGLIDSNSIVILSKIDKLTRGDAASGEGGSRSLSATIEHFKTLCAQQPLAVCGLSVHTEEGLQNFLKELGLIASEMMGTPQNGPAGNNPLMTRARHREHMAECLSFLQQFQDHVSRDLVKATEDLRQAAQSLARIVGAIDVDELLDVIFRDFCIGK